MNDTPWRGMGVLRSLRALVACLRGVVGRELASKAGSAGTVRAGNVCVRGREGAVISVGAQRFEFAALWEKTRFYVGRRQIRASNLLS